MALIKKKVAGQPIVNVGEMPKFPARRGYGTGRLPAAFCDEVLRIKQ